MVKARSAANRAQVALLQFALGLPEAYEDAPWGEVVAKVNKKVFVFFGGNDETLNISVKLPESNIPAVGMPFCKSTGYGLGKSGWVTASFKSNESPPIALLQDWIEESYRAIAPKRCVLLRQAQDDRGRGSG